MTPSSPGYAEMTKYFIDVNAVTANNTVSTYHGYELNNNFDAHIDFCFIDSRIRALGQEVIDQLVDGKFPSDHYGIYSEIEF